MTSKTLGDPSLDRHPCVPQPTDEHPPAFSESRALSPNVRPPTGRLPEPPEAASCPPTPSTQVEEPRTKLEARKLNEEILELREKRKWTPSLKAALPAILISLGTGTVGYLFGDSLKERNLAEIRKATMDRYLAVDNELPGKRKQMLTFVERYLAKDDPELMAWLKGESAVVDEQLRRAKEQVAALEVEVRSLKEDLAKMEASRNEAQSKLETSRSEAQSKLDRIAGQLERKEKELRERDRELVHLPPDR